MARTQLTDEENERVRKLVRKVLAERGMEQTELADKLEVTQGLISGLLSKRQGTTLPFVRALATFLGTTPWEVLGMAGPLAPPSPRDMAAELAHEIGVSDRAIQDVLAEAIEGREHWYTL